MAEEFGFIHLLEHSMHADERFSSPRLFLRTHSPSPQYPISLNVKRSHGGTAEGLNQQSCGTSE
jgi:hypothetical protein